MNEEKIRQMIQDELKRQSTYGDPTILPHDHDGNNSPSILAPTFTYIGFVPYTIDATLERALPKGWTITYFGSGTYQINHNLWTRQRVKFYSFIADATQSTNEKVAPVISSFPDVVSISWFRCTDGTAVDTSFNFQLTIINTLIKNPVTYDIKNTGV